MRGYDIAHVLTTVIVSGFPMLVLVGGRDADSVGVVLLCTVGAAAGAAIACLLARRWPGLAGSWWKLWLATWLFNPVVILFLVYILTQYECLFGQVRGWGCMGLALGVLALPATLIAPTMAVITHVIARRVEREVAAGSH